MTHEWDGISMTYHECEDCEDCGICGEPMCVLDPRPSHSHIGEFVIEPDTHVIAHAECGLNEGYELA